MKRVNIRHSKEQTILDGGVTPGSAATQLDDPFTTDNLTKKVRSPLPRIQKTKFIFKLTAKIERQPV